jgi:hypothetical protein
LLANLFLHWAIDAWMDREFPDCPFERYADDGLIHCKSAARARQVLAALEQRMRDEGRRPGTAPGQDPDRLLQGLRPPPALGRAGVLRLPGCTFRPRDTMGKNGRFTGFDLAASPKAVKRMSETVTGWQLHRLTALTWEQLADWIGPVIRGWMTYYGRFRHSELHPLLARINRRVRQWIRAKYRRLRAYRAMKRAWDRITAQMPGLLPHWRWETGAWY